MQVTNKDKKISTRPLGQTPLQVSELGCGTASFGNLYQAIADDDAKAAMQSALKLGINIFDTAPYYGFGLSERRVGDALRAQHKDAYVISTKVGRLIKPLPDFATRADKFSVRRGFASPMPFEPVYDYTYDGVMRSFEDSLQRLGLARIDILLVHDIGLATHGDHDAHYFAQLKSGGYKALDQLRSQGVIAAIGLGVNEYQVCERAMEFGRFDCFLLAGRYSLLEQEALQTFMPKCQEHGASIIVGGPYNSGILATGVNSGAIPYYNYEPAPDTIIQRVRAIEAVCADFNVPLAAAALQFPLAHPVVSTVIPGLSKPEQVDATLGFFNHEIPTEFWQRLKHQGLLADNAPVPT